MALYTENIIQEPCWYPSIDLNFMKTNWMNDGSKFVFTLISPKCIITVKLNRFLLQIDMPAAKVL